MLGFFSKLIDFLNKYGTFLLNNWYVFAVWTILCITITSLVMNKINSKNNEKLKKENESLKAKVAELGEELKQQKGLYGSMETEAWMTAPKMTASVSSADKISKAVASKSSVRNKSKRGK